MVNTGRLIGKEDGDLAFIAVQSTRRRYEALLFAIRVMINSSNIFCNFGLIRETLSF